MFVAVRIRCYNPLAFAESPLAFSELPIANLSCQLTPLVDRSTATAKPAQPQHAVSDAYSHVELQGNRMFIYAVSTRTKQPYKDEYVVIDFQSFAIKSKSAPPVLIQPLGFGSNLTKINNVNVTYAIDMYLSNGLTVEVFIYLNHPKAPGGVKFSFIVRRDPSLPATQQPLLWPNEDGVSFFLACTFSLRQQHSRTDPLYCQIPSPNFSAFTDCGSDVFSESITYVRVFLFAQYWPRADRLPFLLRLSKR